MKAKLPIDTFPVLITDRLVLRELVAEDVENLYKIFSDESVLVYYDIDPTRTHKHAEELLNFWRKRFYNKKGIRWAIALKDQPEELVGTCGFLNWELPYRVAEIGYELAREYWGKGLMSEAISGVIEFGFNTLNLNRIEAEVFKGNEPSARVLQKLGFTFEGTMRERAIWKGATYDVDIYALLQREYELR